MAISNSPLDLLSRSNYQGSPAAASPALAPPFSRPRPVPRPRPASGPRSSFRVALGRARRRGRSTGYWEQPPAAHAAGLWRSSARPVPDPAGYGAFFLPPSSRSRRPPRRGRGRARATLGSAGRRLRAPRLPTVLRCCAGGRPDVGATASCSDSLGPGTLTASCRHQACRLRSPDFPLTQECFCPGRLKPRDARLQPCFPSSGVGPATCHYALRWGWFCFSSVSQVLLVAELLIISSTGNPQRIRKFAGCGPLVCSVGSHLLPLLPAYTLV